MNAALHYSVEAFDTSKPKLMGRHAAGEGFLRGYARHAKADALYCYTKTKEEFADFEARVARLSGEARPCRWIAPNRADALLEVGCLHYPAPMTGLAAWQRRYFGEKSFSLSGVTHTTATEGVMDALGDMMVAPFQPWDALICTSRVVRETVEHVLARWSTYLESRFGGKARSAVQLPVIPLGVECDEFAPTRASEKTRNAMRKRFGIAKDDVAVLFMGRLSYHAKAHPMPMYLGLEEAAKRTRKRIHLVQAGWFGNESIERSFVDAAKALCPNVRALFVDGRNPEVRSNIWFAADIFASLADNIQETFGLTPVEAMAAGLPVVVSDWNGYRDTVRDGIEGMLIPSFMPPPGPGEGFAFRQAMGIDDYDHYIGYVSQCSGVDVRAAAEAFSALVGDAALRRRMGAAGRTRARENFDWRVVVAAYQALWDELARRREKEAPVAAHAAGEPALPLREDPFAVFAGYPSLTIAGSATVAAMPGAREDDVDRVAGLRMNDYAFEHLLPLPEMKALLGRIIAEGPLAAAAIYGNTTGRPRVLLARSLGWLGKMGLVRFEGIKPRTS